MAKSHAKSLGRWQRSTTPAMIVYISATHYRPSLNNRLLTIQRHTDTDTLVTYSNRF